MNGYGQGETTTCINPPVAGDYTVTVTDVNGCTATVSDVSLAGMNTGCCGNYEHDFDYDYSYSITSDVPITGGSLNVNHDIIISSGATLTLTTCSLAIAPGYQIFVDAGCTLIIEDKSLLSSCTGMWAGIENQGGTVIIDGSEVDDAQYALFSWGYFPNPSIFQITNSTFDRNMIDVALNDDDYSASYFTGNTIQCTGALKNKTYGTLSYEHIVLANVTACSIGDGTAAPNNIKDADKGIYCFNSTFNAENNYFYNLANQNTKTLWDAAIQGGYSTATNKFISTGNHIENCKNGIIMSTEYESTVDGNTFTRCDYGVEVDNDNHSAILIQNSVFTDCDYGVELYNLYSAPFSISDNRFTSVLNSNDEPANTQAIGIHLSSGRSEQSFILRNVIENYPVSIYANGFYTYHGGPSHIAYNHINYKFDVTQMGGLDYKGIWTQGCVNMIIDHNNINWINGPIDPSTLSVEGMRIDGSVGLTVHKNDFSRNGTAVYMTDVSADDYLTCNTITRSYPGVYLDNVSNLPDQGSASETYNNNWFGDYTSSRLKIDGVFTAPSNWYYAGTLDDPTPCNTFAALPQQILGLYTDHCYVPPPDVYYSESAERMLNKVIGDSAVYESDAEENRYNNLQRAYKMMKMDSSLISTVARTQFMQTTESENIGLLITVTDSIASGALVTAESINDAIVDTNIMESNKRTVNDIIITRTVNGVLILTSSDSSVLLSIAYQDPIHGGEAVYKARALLRLRIADNYGGSSARTIKNTSVESIVPDVELYPIPSRGVVFIKTYNTPVTSIRIYDLAGRLIREEFYKNAYAICRLDLSNLVEGYYTAAITVIDEKQYCRQIILTK